LDKLAHSQLTFYVLVTQGMGGEMKMEVVDREMESVFLSKSNAEETIRMATCKVLRDSKFYGYDLYELLEDANSNHNNKSSSDVSKKASAIFGTKIDFSSGKFKLPKNATDEQLIEFSSYLGYAAYSLKKIKLEV
jgi:hypothetical protein